MEQSPKKSLIMNLIMNKTLQAAYIPLKPHSKFHFGEIKEDINVALSHTSNYAPSDILFSSLINCYRDAAGDASLFLNFFAKGDVFISSLFYYLKREDTLVHLLPKPVFLDLFAKRDGHHKLRNKIKFISDGVWKQGFDPDHWLDKNQYQFIQDKEILLTRHEFTALGLTGKEVVFKIVDSPKNPIHDVIILPGDKERSIFYQADIEIGSIDQVEIGFYFIYSLSDDCKTTFEPLLRTAVNVMAFSGIGGEKNNTGRTMGIPGFSEFQLGFDHSAIPMESAFTNIALVNPADDQELQQISYHLTDLRGGLKIKGNPPYKVVRMIKEGALMHHPVKGRLVEIGTDLEGNTAFRNGLCLCLPVKYAVNHE